MKFAALFVFILLFTTAFTQPENTKARDTSATRALSFKRGDKVWMLTYFRQRYPTRIEIDSNGKTIEVPLPNPMLIAKLHIALSTDGRHWTPLNNNEPVWDHFMRDPFIHRSPDGLWRIVSTGGGSREERGKVGPVCLYITSKDLVHYQEEGTLALMKEVKTDSGAFAGNIWAPEWFYDDKKKEYMVFWSSSFKDAGWKESRLWYCTTKDWKTFTAAKVLFAPHYSVIDGTLLKEGDTYYLFHKEEEFGVATGERRAIRVATSKSLEGPYTVVEGDLNKGQIAPTITEGPTAIKDAVKRGWMLYYDYPMADDFGASYSADLKHWTVEKDVSFPPDARHGSISVITAEEARRLVEAYPNKGN